MFIYYNIDRNSSGSKWANVGIKIAALIRELKLKQGERNVFICTFMRIWSRKLGAEVIISRGWLIWFLQE